MKTFFCHSALDSDILLKLKEKVTNITKNEIEIFMASDGQSIPKGSNWVRSIEDALNDTLLMFTFVSSNSIESKWIYFESGYAYSNKERTVIPVIFPNLRMSVVPQPLQFLQGFQITSHESLNNIIFHINEKYAKSYPLEFKPADYIEIFSGSSYAYFGKLQQKINNIKFYVSDNLKESKLINTWQEIIRVMKAQKQHFSIDENQLSFIGFKIILDQQTSADNSRLEFELVPTAIQHYQDLLNTIILGIRKNGWQNINLHIAFDSGVYMEDEKYKIAPFLLGLDFDISLPGHVFRLNNAMVQLGRAASKVMVSTNDETELFPTAARAINQLNQLGVIKSI